MLKILKAAILLVFTVFLSIQSYANCTITGTPNNSSGNPLSGCSGVVTISGTLTINGNYNVGSQAITSVVITSTGIINWTGNFNFNLPAGCTLVIQSGGQLTTSTACNSLKSLSIGGTSITTCNGNNVNYSFAQMMAGGGYGGANAVTASSNSPVCQGSSLQLNCSPSGGVTPYTYSWTGPGGYTSTVQNPLVGSPATGTYTVVVTDVLGVTATASTSATVNPAPTVTGSTGNAICGSGSMNISATSSAGSTIDWYANVTLGSPLLSGSNTYTTPVISSTTTYYAQARDLTTGCTTLSRSAVTATINPIPTAGISYSAASFCNNLTNASVSITGQTGGSFSSSAGLSINAASGAIDPSLSTVGNYVVTYSFSNGLCSNSTTANVSIVANAFATISYSASAFCSMDAGAKTVTITGSTGGTFSSTTGLSINSSNGSIQPNLSSPGSYVVSYILQANGACSGYTATTTVDIQSPATVNAGLDAAVCYGVAANLSGSIAPSGSTTWISRGNGVFGNASSLATTYQPGTADSTNGAVWIILQNNNIGCPSSDSLLLTINKIPAAPGAITTPRFICAGNSGTVSINPVPAATSYIWWADVPSTILNTGTTNSTLSVPPVMPNSGTYISVRAVNSCGVSDSTKGWVRSYISVPTLSPNTTVCPGTTVTFWSRSIQGADSVRWTFPAGATGVQINDTTYSVSFSNSYVTSNFIINAYFPCLNTSLTRSVATVASRTPGNISGLSTSLCDTTITYSISPVVDATGYVWTVPAGVTVVGPTNTTSITLTFGSFTTGNLSVQSINSCNIVSAARTLALKGTPATPASITGPSSVCALQTNLVYTAASVVGASSYQWTVASGASILSGQGTNSITVKWGTANGNVNVRASRSCSGLGSSKSYAVTVTCRTGEQHVSDNTVEIYPNPNNGNFHIQLYTEENANVRFSIMDMSGRQVYQQQSSHNAGLQKHAMQLTLPQGIYLLKAETGESVVLKKFVVE